MVNPEREIRATLAGGIGNQLFQYCYAIKTAERYGGRVTLDLRGLPTRGQQKGSSIQDLDIDYLSVKTGNKFLNYARKLLIMKSLSNQSTPFSDRFLGIQREFKVEPRFDQRIVVANYFGDVEALDYFTGSRPISLAEQPNLEVRREYSMVQSSSTVVIHHRLGDAVSLRSSRGQLGKLYFLNSLLELEESGISIDKVRIYSDDNERSMELLGAWLARYDLTWADPHLSAAEVLTIMARARNIVLSNSTMSWWAGAAGEHEEVIAPAEWDREGRDGLNLPSWDLEQPDWL